LASGAASTNAAYKSATASGALLTAAGILGGAAGGFAFLLVAAIRRWFG